MFVDRSTLILHCGATFGLLQTKQPRWDTSPPSEPRGCRRCHSISFRTPDRSKQQFPLTKAQKTGFRELLAQKFRIELAKSKQLRLVEEAGLNVLRLKIRVQDILASIPPRSIGNVGLAGFALEAIGEATIVLELRDSQSEETLARAADTRTVEGAAILQKGGALTRWSEVETLCERWASTVRKRIDTLVERH